MEPACGGVDVHASRGYASGVAHANFILFLLYNYNHNSCSKKKRNTNNLKIIISYLSSMVLISCQRTRPLRVATKATEIPKSLNMACLYKIQIRKN
jgi:hypothetical protein